MDDDNGLQNTDTALENQKYLLQTGSKEGKELDIISTLCRPHLFQIGPADSPKHSPLFDLTKTLIGQFDCGDMITVRVNVRSNDLFMYN